MLTLESLKGYLLPFWLNYKFLIYINATTFYVINSLLVTSLPFISTPSFPLDPPLWLRPSPSTIVGSVPLPVLYHYRCCTTPLNVNLVILDLVIAWNLWLHYNACIMPHFCRAASHTWSSQGERLSHCSPTPHSEPPSLPSLTLYRFFYHPSLCTA